MKELLSARNSVEVLLHVYYKTFIAIQFKALLISKFRLTCLVLLRNTISILELFISLIIKCYCVESGTRSFRNRAAIKVPENVPLMVARSLNYVQEDAVFKGKFVIVSI